MASAIVPATLFALVLASGPVLAAGSGDSEMGPLRRSDQGISYLTGGIGEDERAEVLRLSEDYPLKLVFAHADRGLSRAPYAAMVDVEILDASGRTVFSAQDAGPLLFVDVPPGKYRVAATLHGRELEKDVTLDGRRQQVAFYW